MMLLSIVVRNHHNGLNSLKGLIALILSRQAATIFLRDEVRVRREARPLTTLSTAGAPTLHYTEGIARAPTLPTP